MSWKRFAAVLVAGPLMYLNAARADVACARHDGAHAAAPETVDSDAHASHHTQTAPERTTPDADQCEQPSQANCCQALVSCSLLIGFAEGTQGTLLAFAHAGAAVKFADMPLMRAAAPDPPPPRI